jgi:hypothetical protein
MTSSISSHGVDLLSMGSSAYSTAPSLSSSSSSSSSIRKKDKSSDKISSSSSNTLYHTTSDIKFVYIDKNKKETTVNKEQQVHYLDSEGKLYDANKKRLNYEIYDIIDKTNYEQKKIIVKIDPLALPDYSSVSTGYNMIDEEPVRLYRINDTTITYYDEHDNIIQPSEYSTVYYFDVLDTDDGFYLYRYYNKNKRRLYYDTIDFDAKFGISIKKTKHVSSNSVRFSNSSRHSSLFSNHEDIPSKSKDTVYSSSKSSLMKVDNPIIYKNENMETIIPVSSEKKIKFYDSNNNYYNYKKDKLNYYVFKNSSKDDTLIAKIIRSSPSHSPSSKVSITDEKIKLCTKWGINKKANPDRPINPLTNRNIKSNGIIYNKLDKICEKIPVNIDKPVSSKSSQVAQDDKTVKICAKWNLIKKTQPDNKLYNPENKKKTPIKKGAATYNRLNKMCKNIKIASDYKLSSSPSSSKSSFIDNADPLIIKTCNKWAAIKNKYPNTPYNPENKKKTKIKVNGPKYKQLDKMCRKIQIDPIYKLSETSNTSQDKNDDKLMKQCKALEKLEKKFKADPNNPDLIDKIQKYKDKLKALKSKCKIINKKDIEQIIVNEDDRFTCMQWKKIKKDFPNNLYNPKTKSLINKDGPTYKKLENKCKDYKIDDDELDEVKIANPKKNLEKKVLNSTLCMEWTENKSINPLTNKYIQKEGKIYKEIRGKCKQLMKKKRSRS